MWSPPRSPSSTTNGNNSEGNLQALEGTKIGFVGSLVPTQHADLLDVANDEFRPVEDLSGVVAYRCGKEIAGTLRTVVVTRSQTFLAKQLVGIAQTRARVEVQLTELVRLLSGHRHGMDAAKLAARVNEALAPRWMARLYRTTITGNTRDDLSLVWSFDEEAFAELKDLELGKRIVFTDRAGGRPRRSSSPTALSGRRRRRFAS